VEEYIEATGTDLCNEDDTCMVGTVVTKIDVLIPIIACITRDTIITMIPIVGRYEIPTDDLKHVMRSITSST